MLTANSTDQTDVKKVQHECCEAHTCSDCMWKTLEEGVCYNCGQPPRYDPKRIIVVQWYMPMLPPTAPGLKIDRKELRRNGPLGHMKTRRDPAQGWNDWETD